MVTLVIKESVVGYYPYVIGILTSYHNLVHGQCLVDSLTGAVAS